MMHLQTEQIQTISSITKNIFEMYLIKMILKNFIAIIHFFTL
jgi:hypothetical protein